jgi:hypothetical protein
MRTERLQDDNRSECSVFLQQNQKASSEGKMEDDVNFGKERIVKGERSS